MDFAGNLPRFYSAQMLLHVFLFPRVTRTYVLGFPLCLSFHGYIYIYSLATCLPHTYKWDCTLYSVQTVHCTLSSNYILMAALEMSQFLEGIDHNTDQK